MALIYFFYPSLFMLTKTFFFASINETKKSLMRILQFGHLQMVTVILARISISSLLTTSNQMDFSLNINNRKNEKMKSKVSYYSAEKTGWCRLFNSKILALLSGIYTFVSIKLLFIFFVNE